MPRILTLDEIEGEPVGGKAAGLARLRAMGLRVPEAVVIVEATLHTTAAEFDALVAALEGRFGPGRLAIRSSAIGEDGAEASFAGQYESVLEVEGAEAIREAIETCLRSAENVRARFYRDLRDAASEGRGVVEMAVVVQRMVDARVSGVCFSVDPVTSRRNRLVLDSVAGLGEALVSGHASPDHDEFLRREQRWETTRLAGENALLLPVERATLAREALEAEHRTGSPVDLEWAIDREGTLHWLQARPITTLGLDPQCLDVVAEDRTDVHTRCNVGEMMPGAVSPLTYSTCAQGIDAGWQRIKDAVGVPSGGSAPSRYLSMSHGHLFINMSEGARFSSSVSGAHPDQQSLALCGRLVPEVVADAPPPIWVRIPRLLRQVGAMLRPRRRIRRLQALTARGPIAVGATSLETWREIDARLPDLHEGYQLHLVVSSSAGALAPIMLARLAGGEEPTDEHHAIVASVLSGAEGVESADIAEGAERILDALLAASDRSSAFVDLEPDLALRWLRGDASGEAGRVFRAYLTRHGHRSLRELDIRQPEWAHDPTPLLRSLQTQLRGRLAGDAPLSLMPVACLDRPAGAERFDRARGIAHAAVRNRERCKSLLVELTVLFKQAYRALGRQLVEEGRLPDADAVYFLLHEELETLARAEPGDSLVDDAIARRDVLAYQETLRFPEVAVGLPQPVSWRVVAGGERIIVGKPVSRGRVEGPVRVVESLAEAEALAPGEILVAPITDVGWTPYFTIIAGLVTDVGSAVSHGAVVAREYGLPAVLNTHDATRILKTGERVVLDGDRGTIERLG
ncbi:MAG: pyruvate, water dikinase [bacterium]|nr:pyruvate, water dikinase [Deltaproteobacteria bacterium]MCP4906440.1 pyruvate, water dikinase [bacterium]